jgi:hypothetical protein
VIDFLKLADLLTKDQMEKVRQRMQKRTGHDPSEWITRLKAAKSTEESDAITRELPTPKEEDLPPSVIELVTTLSAFLRSGSFYSPYSEHLACLLLFCLDEHRICPQPIAWDRLWKTLPDRRNSGRFMEPRPPLILSAWWNSSDWQKQARFLEHVVWAGEHGALNETMVFLKSLEPSEWLYSNGNR